MYAGSIWGESVAFSILEEFPSWSPKKVSFIAELDGGFVAPPSITVSVITLYSSSSSLVSIMSLTSSLYTFLLILSKIFIPGSNLRTGRSMYFKVLNEPGSFVTFFAFSVSLSREILPEKTSTCLVYFIFYIGYYIIIFNIIFIFLAYSYIFLWARLSFL